MTEGFEEFLRERREHAERTQRLLIGVLVATCIALAVSNVVLALWLTSSRTRSTAESPARLARERSAPASETPPAASIPSRGEEAPPAVTLPKTTDSTAAEPRSANTPTQPPARVAAPPARTEASPAAEPPTPAVELPARSGVTSGPARRPTAPRVATAPTPSRAPSAAHGAPGLVAPEEATAAWMLSTYGRAEAESRAQAAIEFYSPQSAEGRYWRRVLARIVTAR